MRFVRGCAVVTLSVAALIMASCGSDGDDLQRQRDTHTADGRIRACLQAKLIGNGNGGFSRLFSFHMNDGSLSTVQFVLGEWPDHRMFRATRLTAKGLAAIRTNDYARANQTGSSYRGLSEFEDSSIRTTLLANDRIRYDSSTEYGIVEGQSSNPGVNQTAAIVDNWLVVMKTTVHDTATALPDDPELQLGREATLVLARQYESCRTRYPFS